LATLTPIAASPGAGGKRPVQNLGPRVLVFAEYTFAFDSSYVTGGEDISAIWNDFKEVLAVIVDAPPFVAATGKNVRIDKTAKKAMLYDNAAVPAQVASASDQSTVTGITLIAIGY
jgi:hypothetical protein